MVELTSPYQSQVTFDFSLPHGIDAEGDPHGVHQAKPEEDASADALWSFSHVTDHGNAMDNAQSVARESRQEHDEQNFNYRQFSPGFSDDEDSREVLDHSRQTLEANKQAVGIAKGTKSPRRSDSEETSESGARAKKPRQSLFGSSGAEMEGEEQIDNLLAPATPGQSLGNRMSSLNLDQQKNGEEDASMTVGFGLACSDIGSVRDSPAPSDDEVIIPPENYYELRQNIDRKKTITHIDTDKSGNWDPEQEARERTAKLARAKAAKQEKRGKRRRKGKAGTSREYTMKCIVKLSFDAFGNVRNITNDEQKWPRDWSDIDSEQERELEGYRETYRTNTPDFIRQLPLEDPAVEVDDLTGHPAARGCKQCRKIGQDCSMVKDSRYPCEECIEDGSECQPIQKPTVKGRCKQCDRANQEVCSFEDDPTQPICDHCADNDHICEALPLDGYKVQRIDLDEIVYGPDRPHIACTHCRILKKRCNLKTKEDKPPCKHCKKNNLGCHFFDLPEQDPEKRITEKKTLIERIAPDVAKPNSEFFTAEDLADMEQRNDVVLERESTPEMEMEDAEGNKGMLTKITTSFAHPVRFAVRRSDTSDCNFCDVPVFGFVGHFERQVHVVRWYSGLGFAEVGGGHCQDMGETRMCQECTNRRVQIVVCPGHEFERMVDMVVDHDMLTEELSTAEVGGADMQYQLQRWCSLCFSPAVFGCSTVQPHVVEGGGEITGCHLRLCIDCEKALRVDFGGDFERMVAYMDIQPKISEGDDVLGHEIVGRPRADVGFLTQCGLLMQTVMRTVPAGS